MFNSLTDEERQEVREVLEDKPAEEEPQEVVDEKVEVEEEKSELGETDIEEGKEMPKNEEQDKIEEKTAETEKVAENSTTPSSEVQPTDEGVVKENPEEQVRKGVRIEDVVLKDELFAHLDALNAKFDAVVKENTDLKNELSAMKDKYENKDFGNMHKQGLIQNDKSANEQFKETFEEYAKKFM